MKPEIDRETTYTIIFFEIVVFQFYGVSWIFRPA